MNVKNEHIRATLIREKDYPSRIDCIDIQSNSNYLIIYTPEAALSLAYQLMSLAAKLRRANEERKNE